MVASKKKKKSVRGKSDKVARKKQSTESKKLNPFEIRVNKHKHNILGQKVKHDRGIPGLSRSKAIKKRKATLLQEYKQRAKSNKFVDRRLGEYDANMTPEEKLMERFAVERQRHHQKATTLYNLNEDEEEELTHFGQSLSTIERFEDRPGDDDSDEDPEAGRLTSSYVKEEHFGGFLTKKNPNNKEVGAPKSKKEKLEEIIAQSKKEKYRAQFQKEESAELREKLDKEWLEIKHLLDNAKRKRAEEEAAAAAKTKASDYDIAVNQLKYDIKAKATDRLKTPEEVAKEEKERLEKLEADRRRRMRGISEEDMEEPEKKRVKFSNSADSLNEGYVLKKPERFHLSYKDGQILSGGPDGANPELEGSQKKRAVPERDDEDSEDAEDEEGSEEEDADDDGSESENDEEDYGEDLEDPEDEEESGDEDEPTREKRQTVIKEAEKELPYTFEAPETFEDLRSLLSSRSGASQLVVLERLHKCHHPSLAQGNSLKLQQILSFALEYLAHLALSSPPRLDLINSLAKGHIYELAQQYPITAAQALRSLIFDKQGELKEARGGSSRRKPPPLDFMIFVRLVPILFTTSDFYHPVVTPVTLYMTQMLSSLCPSSLKNVAIALYLCSTLLEYVGLSKRLVPEALSYLRGLLLLATPGASSTGSALAPFPPPFSTITTKDRHLLHLAKPRSKSKVTGSLPLGLIFDQSGSSLDAEEVKVEAVLMCVRLLAAFANLYQELPSFTQLFHPIHQLITSPQFPLESYPDRVQVEVKLLAEFIASQGPKSTQGRKSLRWAKKKPQSIKFFEPLVDEKFDVRKKGSAATGDRQANEKRRLIHLHRKEMKGALREIRKDTQFLARQKLEENIQRDRERSAKVKRLNHFLSTQEGEYREMKRNQKYGRLPKTE